MSQYIITIKYDIEDRELAEEICAGIVDYVDNADSNGPVFNVTLETIIPASKRVVFPEARGREELLRLRSLEVAEDDR